MGKKSPKMDTEEIKKEIIRKLQTVTDKELIAEDNELLNPEVLIENNSIEDLPPEIQNKINRALDDFNAGRYITHEQMNQKVNQWLTK